MAQPPFSALTPADIAAAINPNPPPTQNVVRQIKKLTPPDPRTILQGRPKGRGGRRV